MYRAMSSSAFSCTDLGVIDLLNSIGSVIALEGKKSTVSADSYWDEAEQDKSKSFGSEISTAIDRASRHLNDFIGIEADGDNDSALLRNKYSNLCIITCHFGEFSLLLRMKGKIYRMERFGCDGHAALSRARDLGYRARCRELESLVCHIGRRDEEMIVCVLSCA